MEVLRIWGLIRASLANINWLAQVDISSGKVFLDGATARFGLQFILLSQKINCNLVLSALVGVCSQARKKTRFASARRRPIQKHKFFALRAFFDLKEF